MVWLNIAVILSVSNGNESVKRFTCEIKRAPNAAITKKVRNNVTEIATTLFIFLSTKKFTTGCSTMATMVAKTRGIIMLLAIYNIASKANNPIIKIVDFAYDGNFNFSSVTVFQSSLLSAKKIMKDSLTEGFNSVMVLGNKVSNTKLQNMTEKLSEFIAGCSYKYFF